MRNKVRSVSNRQPNKIGLYRMTRMFTAIVAAILLSTSALAQAPGDARKGGELARTACVQCHGVRPRQSRSPDPMAPSFARIATAPGMTDRALRVWLQSSHPAMPNFILTGDERNDVIAYILSLNDGNSAM